MSAANMERLLDLLADRAGGEVLTQDDTNELDHLLGEHPEVDPDSFDLAAAALHLALIEPELQPLPASIRARLDQTADSFLAGPGPRPLPEARADQASGVLTWSGWFAAAAAILLLFLKTSVSGVPTYSEVMGSTDVVVAGWSRTEDPSATGVDGRVAWSDELQSGYMEFEGLPENDPEEGQYQLWIFDPEHPPETPVDGGVFDSDGARIRVPIDAKLGVRAPSLFAITYERPGGVVVSKRDRLILTAAPE